MVVTLIEQKEEKNEAPNENLIYYRVLERMNKLFEGFRREIKEMHKEIDELTLKVEHMKVYQ